VTPDDLRSVHEGEILLGRRRRFIEITAGLRVLQGASALITGAGGSVGSALARRLGTLGVAQITAVDHHEASLFRLGRDTAGSAPIALRLADVRNVDKMARILREYRPTAVFHLAAYKHVPIGEQEPDEVMTVNVQATAELLRAASSAGVDHFVYPSSDKAVNPPSLYGASKRLAESAVLARAMDSSAMAVHVVRYVNILGTNGSVIETFARQIREGLPLTLTDAHMTRYWMTMDEAIDMVIHALALSSGSCTMLDVGEPIPVREMAVRVARLVAPELDTPPTMVETGPRPGERLAEELFSRSERPLGRELDDVWEIAHARRAECSGRIRAMLDELERLIAEAPPDCLRTRAMELAAELQ